MAKVSPSTHVFVELESDLPGGYRDIQTIHSTINEYGGEIRKECVDRGPDRLGRWRSTHLTILAWVPRDRYHAFATSLGMLQKKGKLTLTATTYL